MWKYFLGAMIIFLIAPLASEAATLYVLPQSGTAYQSRTFLVNVMLDSENERINAAEIYLHFSNDLLKVVSVEKGGSILKLWPKEIYFSNEKGEISFSGGVPGGFLGQGKLISITFNVLKNGEASKRALVNFKKTSKVLLNDGKGTLASLNFLEGNYKVIPLPKELPVLTSPSNPDEDKWYPKNSSEIHWKRKPGAEYSYILSRDSLAEPDEIPEKLIEDLKWEGVKDGVYYFHLKQKLPGEKWSEKITYRFKIDTTPPEPFKPEIGRDPSIFGGKYFLSFAATDKTSGVDHYEVIELPYKKIFGFLPSNKYYSESEINKEWKKAKSPYLLKDQKLMSLIKVKAVDKAGNERVEEIYPSKKPVPYWVLFVILAGVIVIWRLIEKIKAIYRKKQKNR